MNSLFEGNTANDAKDLLNYILMTMHKELNSIDINDCNDDSNLKIDQRNKEQVLKSYTDNYIKHNKSIIKGLLFML